MAVEAAFGATPGTGAAAVAGADVVGAAEGVPPGTPCTGAGGVPPDGAGFGTFAAGGAYDTTWTYDDIGNTQIATDHTSGTAQTNYYQYVDGAHPHAPTSVSGVASGTYGYDANGNTTNRSANSTFLVNGLSTTGSQLCLDDAAGGTADGNKIQLHTCDQGNEQFASAEPDGTIRILGKCLNVTGGGTANGAFVQLHTCDGTASQNWTVRADGTIRNPQSGRCLDDSGNATTDGNQIDIWDCYGGQGQNWAAGKATPALTVGANQALTWNAEQQLTSIIAAAGTTGYVYGPDGNRLIRHDPGTNHATLFLGGEELALNGAAVTATRYYTEGATTVAQRTATGVTWLLADTQGTTSIAVDATTGAVIRQYYTPYGQQISGSTLQATTDHAFLGRVQDYGTGLVQDGARYYDPTIGHFISPDPLNSGSPDQLNAYAYAGDNPATDSDPTGRSTPARPRHAPRKDSNTVAANA